MARQFPITCGCGAAGLAIMDAGATLSAPDGWAALYIDAAGGALVVYRCCACLSTTPELSAAEEEQAAQVLLDLEAVFFGDEPEADTATEPPSNLDVPLPDLSLPLAEMERIQRCAFTGGRA